MTDSSLTSDYYQSASRIPFASSLSIAVRRGIYKRFMEVMHPGEHDSILDIGITSDEAHAESNFFEQWYPRPQSIIGLGHELSRGMSSSIAVVRGDGCAVPLRSNSVAITFSHAVLEHVGSRERQRAFLEECVRVSERVFVTTPNRWFPVEMHTGLPLLHYLPAASFRRILTTLGMDFYANEQALNLLTERNLRDLTDGLPLRVELFSHRGITTHLIARTPD